MCDMVMCIYVATVSLPVQDDVICCMAWILPTFTTDELTTQQAFLPQWVLNGDVDPLCLCEYSLWCLQQPFPFFLFLLLLSALYAFYNVMH